MLNDTRFTGVEGETAYVRDEGGWGLHGRSHKVCVSKIRGQSKESK